MLNRFRAFALSLLVLTAGAHAATLLPPGKQVFLDDNGNPLSGGTVTFYIPGTTTPKDTYQDAGGTILNANPLTLDSAGRGVIYGSGAYREVVKDSLGNTIYDQITADTSSSNTSWGGHSGGSANAQTVSAASFTSGDGQVISFIAGFSNTTATTLNPSGAGGLNILKDLPAGSVSLSGGEIVAGNVVSVVYDATLGAFHLASLPPPNTSEPFTSVASATTTDLGLAATRNVTITGTTGITSFGSSASTSFPVYRLRFAGALTLTHNGTSLILPSAANITTAANDSASAVYLGSGNWQVISYQRANGKALVETQQLPTQTGNGRKVLTTDGTNPSWSGLVATANASVAAGGAVTFANNMSISGTTTSTWTVTLSGLANANYSISISQGYTGGSASIAGISSKTSTGFTVSWVTYNAGGGSVPGTAIDFTIVGGL